MQYSEKISVIIPIYKVEHYLNRCIQSIIEQTYDNLEIILINDGSPDKCGQICDEWIKKDSRIKVIHKKNGGLSEARNVGMDVANGKYIAFVDSDDWIHKEMIEMLYNDIQTHESDISACGVELVSETGEKLSVLTRKGNVTLSNEDAMQALVEDTWLKQPVWYKLYKKELIKELRFPVGKYHEDVFWSYQAIAKANKVSVFDKIGYYYVQRENSIMGQQYSVKRLDAIEAKKQRFLFVRSNYPKLTEIAARDLTFACMYHGQQAIKNLTQKEYIKIIEYLNAILKQNNIFQIEYKKSTTKQKMWIKCAKISLVYTCRLRNFLGIGL